MLSCVIDELGAFGGSSGVHDSYRRFCCCLKEPAAGEKYAGSNTSTL
jgi:hypothetical protein